MSEVDSLDDFLKGHAPIPSDAVFASGTIISHWRIVAFLGRGGSAEVYRAVHVALGMSAAVKVLVRDEPRARERFMREAKLLSELKSASFPQFLEYGEANGLPYLVMELLEPDDLPSGDRDVALFLRQVCEAVAELHVRGIVHRDIKPCNILWRTVGASVPRDHVPVLADLGLAKDVSTSDIGRSISNITVGGVGTPGYGAPEQMERGEASVASDIHALGVLADRCFGGNPPRAWTRIIERATSSIPERRYQSVAALVKAIQRRNLSRRLGIGLLMFFFAGLSAATFVMLYRQYGGEEWKWWSICSHEPIVSVEREYVPYENPVSGRKGYRIVTKTNTVDGVVIRLNGETVSFAKPMSLEPGEYRIIGPGRLDADISGTSNVVVRLKGCILNNLTWEEHRKNKVNYVLEGDAYLNFVNLDEDYRIRKCIRHFDGLSNGNGGDVGPPTREELRKVQRDRREREWQKELDEANTPRYDDPRTRIF